MKQRKGYMKITVFTPTYNRGYIIENLYRSLQRQSFKDFEWVVIDDGSTDDTEEKFKEFLKDDNFFSIVYRKTENGGKHRAINKGVALAKGQLFFIVDSDDYLTDDSLEKIVNTEESIPKEKKQEFAGVCGLRGFSKEKIIGKTFEGEILDITTLERPQYGIIGDKSEVFYTEILRKYPFPEFEKENFITECVVWDKIANDGYKLRFFNEIVYLGNYLSDGLTSKGYTIFDANPKGYGLYLMQSAQYGKISGLSKWNQFSDFFYKHRKEFSLMEISKMLGVNQISFYLRIIGLRFVYRIYR